MSIEQGQVRRKFLRGLIFLKGEDEWDQIH